MNNLLEPTQLDRIEAKLDQLLAAKKKPVAKPVDSRATRLSPDWKPSEADVKYCRTKRPDLHPITVADNFRDYWISKPGGLKLDWAATWRTWVRKEPPVIHSATVSPTHDVVDFKKLREAEMALDTVDPYAAFRK